MRVFTRRVLCCGVRVALCFLVGNTATGAQTPAPQAAGETERVLLPTPLDLGAVAGPVSERHERADWSTTRRHEGFSVTVRSASGFTVPELWDLTNQILASRGYTTVHSAGTDVIRVIKRVDAAEASRIDDVAATPGPDGEARSGYSSVAYPAQEHFREEAAESLSPCSLSKAALLPSAGNHRDSFDLRHRASRRAGAAHP